MSSEATNPGIERQYWCFISYRHADNKEEGRQWASWLHQQLETYEVPADLVGELNERGEEIPSRIFPVFRDEEELGAGNLTERIFRALESSRVLAVLCSPRAFESEYVREEIRYFKQMGKGGNVYAALLESGPDESFPETLRFTVDRQGVILHHEVVEPLAADFRLPDGGEKVVPPPSGPESGSRTGSPSGPGGPWWPRLGSRERGLATTCDGVRETHLYQGFSNFDFADQFLEPALTVNELWE